MGEQAAAAQNDESECDLDAEVREVRARAAARRARFEREREDARARRQAEAAAVAEAWEAQVRAHREATATAAHERAEGVERARRDRLDRAAALVSESGANVDRRMRQLREAEAIRKQELAVRAKARAAEIATRKQVGRAMDAALVENLERTDIERQRQTELARAAAVQTRSADARNMARSWLIQPRETREDAPPPWPGEQAAVEHRVVDVPPPRPPAPVTERVRAVLPGAETAAAATAPESPARATAPPPPPAPEVSAKPRGGRAARERVAVTPLDLDVLNALLQQAPPAE